MLKNSGEKGFALIACVFVLMVLAGLSMTLSQMTYAESSANKSSKEQIDSLYVAEAGAAAAMAELRSNNDSAKNGIGIIDTTIGAGNVITTIADIGGGMRRIIATATVGNNQKQVEVIASGTDGGIFWNSIFAGNSQADPNYNMPFGGVGTAGDEIAGDVYSGQNLSVAEDAQINGSVVTTGTATGVPYTQETQPIPDLRAMGYETNHDVNVAQEFATLGAYQYDAAGGNAYQVPQSSLAHIFRKNPSDRSSETNSTTQDDYFLEDPYEAVHSDPNQNGSDAYHLALNDSADPAQDGNQKIYYIDGNLWLHNKNTYSFKFYHSQAEGIQITFVVKGNIYFSDNLFLLNQNNDGVLFIAMRDENVEDSGNIYLGDPAFGTVKELNTFLYAENNFIDQNLDEAGSAEFAINGVMSAGNQVNINRDYYNPPYYEWVKIKGKWRQVWYDGYWTHSKMLVNFDDRVKEGLLALPGMPVASNAISWNIVSWRSL